MKRKAWIPTVARPSDRCPTLVIAACESSTDESTPTGSRWQWHRSEWRRWERRETRPATRAWAAPRRLRARTLTCLHTGAACGPPLIAAGHGSTESATCRLARRTTRACASNARLLQRQVRRDLQPLNTLCKTLNNDCTDGAECCSGLCSAGFCPSFPHFADRP